VFVFGTHAGMEYTNCMDSNPIYLVGAHGVRPFAIPKTDYRFPPGNMPCAGLFPASHTPTRIFVFGADAIRPYIRERGWIVFVFGTHAGMEYTNRVDSNPIYLVEAHGVRPFVIPKTDHRFPSGNSHAQVYFLRPPYQRGSSFWGGCHPPLHPRGGWVVVVHGTHIGMEYTNRADSNRFIL
jgi:hypothetical protein